MKCNDEDVSDLRIGNSTLRQRDGANISRLKSSHVGGLLVTPDPLFVIRRSEIVALMTRYAVPTAYWDRAFPETDGLISYGSNGLEMYQQVGAYAGRILKGEKPSDLANPAEANEVAFPAGWNWRHRHLRTDFVRLDKRTLVIFIQDAPGQEELNGAGEVRAVPGEDCGRIENRAENVVGAIARRIVANELTDLSIVLLRSKIMIACGNHIADVDKTLALFGTGVIVRRTC
jgi:hypothetical protein